MEPIKLSDAYGIDGVKRNKEHPDTFQIPGDTACRGLSIGAFAKIGMDQPKRGGERFWVQITEITPTGYVGRVDNNLVIYPEFDGKTLITFEPEHVLGVL